MNRFCFTVDDNIRFLKEIAENKCISIFDHPYLAMYKRLHEKFNLKVQLNLFYRMDDFDISKMPDKYLDEWKENSEWLKLSFHSDFENEKPYEFSSYDEVYNDCKKVHDNIVRFASETALAKTTTIHYCLATEEGLKALRDNNVSGLLGLFGTAKNQRTSYGISAENAQRIRNGEIITENEIKFASIDIILNCYSTEEILSKLKSFKNRDLIKVMIHEQYFYPDYAAYQPEFEEKLIATFNFFKNNNFESVFFEKVILWK